MQPEKTFDFGSDSASSIALGATSGKESGTAETREAGAGNANANGEIRWLTLRMANQPGFVLTGSRIEGP